MLLVFRITKPHDTDMKTTFPMLGIVYRGGLLRVHNASINTPVWVEVRLFKALRVNEESQA